MNTITVKPDGTGIVVAAPGPQGPPGVGGVWGSIFGTLSDQKDLYEKIRNDQLAIKSPADISSFLVGSSYELPAGRYVFDADLNIGTDNFKLIDATGFYTFKFSDINTITYTGTGSMFDASTVAGIAIKMDDGFLNAPNASEIFLCTDMNSLILTLVICIAGTGRVATCTDTSFVTLNDFVMAGSADGILCTACGTVTAKLLQWNSGAGTGGTALSVTGASSDRLIISTCDARPIATESYLYIDASYTGFVSITSGVFDISTGGAFFGATSLVGADPNIFIGGVVNVRASTAEIFSSFSGSATETVIATISTPVKITGTWNDIKKERFTFDSSGRWTYTGLEEKDVSITLSTTLNPSGGGTRNISTYFAVNGVVDTGTKGSVAASTGSRLTNIAILTLNTGDYIESFVENNSGTQNVVVEDASIRIT
jgi:hypothetical protein